MKRYCKYVMCLIGVVIICLSGSASATAIPVIYINEEVVSQEEFEFFLEQEKSSIYTYFKINHGVENQKGFWEHSFSGDTPLDMLKEKAYSEIIRVKGIQILAKEQGLVKDITFDNLKLEADKFNKERRKAIGNNKIVYGPVEMTLSEYQAYYLSNLELNLKEELEKGVLQITEQEIIDFYDKEGKYIYQLEPIIEIGCIAINYQEKEEEVAKKKILEAKRLIEGGRDFEEVCKEYNEDNEMIKYTFLQQNTKQDNIQYYEILRRIKELNELEYSDIFKSNGAYQIIKVLNRTGQQSIPINELMNKIRVMLLNNKFDEYLKKESDKFKTVINEKVYKEISID